MKQVHAEELSSSSASPHFHGPASDLRSLNNSLHAGHLQLVSADHYGDSSSAKFSLRGRSQATQQVGMQGRSQCDSTMPKGNAGAVAIETPLHLLAEYPITNPLREMV